MRHYLTKKLKCFAILILFHCSTSSFAFQLEEATISSITTAIQQHEITCEELVSSYLKRIKEFDLSTSSSAPINAITEINRSALIIARELDAVFAKNKTLSGPLHCVPVILKDNIDSYDTSTTSGSFALLGNQPNSDAFLTAKLRAAGAIILAKGGMDEFAWGMSGISSRNGRIGNPYDTTQNPGGSSGGPAAAISANFALAGIGSDNSGSVRIPAVFNGLTGLRPSTGLISQTGMFPMGKLDGIAGPMTRTVTDLAKILDVIATHDPDDQKTQHMQRPQTYTAFLNESGLQKKRIGIVRKVGNIDTFHNMPDDINTVMQQTFKKMKSLGASFIDINLNDFDNNRDFNQAGEIQDINRYLASYPATRKNFRDICESNRTRNFGSMHECLTFMHKIKSQTTHAIQQANAIFTKNRHYVAKIMQEKHLDALLIPITTKGVPTYDAMSVNTWRAPVSSNTGMPSIAFVVDYLHNMPIGIELTGKQYDESTLIAMAYAFEKHYPARKIPAMPAANSKVESMSDAEFNNIINKLGQQTYEKILIKHKNNAAQLTPITFKKITESTLASFH